MNATEQAKLKVYKQYCEQKNINPNRGSSVVRFRKFLKTSLVEELFFK